MQQEYRNRELIHGLCENLGAQLDLLSEAILLQRQLKDINEQMEKNRRDVKSDLARPGEIATFDERFRHLQGMYNNVATRKAWIDSQLVGPDQLLEFLHHVKLFTEGAISDYTYSWGRGEEKKNG